MLGRAPGRTTRITRTKSERCGVQPTIAINVMIISCFCLVSCVLSCSVLLPVSASLRLPIASLQALRRTRLLGEEAKEGSEVVQCCCIGRSQLTDGQHG